MKVTDSIKTIKGEFVEVVRGKKKIKKQTKNPNPEAFIRNYMIQMEDHLKYAVEMVISHWTEALCLTWP